jgi:DNA repair protein RadC
MPAYAVQRTGEKSPVSATGRSPRAGRSHRIRESAVLSPPASGPGSPDDAAPLYVVLSGLKALPESERPRERLLGSGADALSPAELIAIILGTGSRGEMVTDLARALLVEFGGLRGLARASVAELRRRKGLGDAKIAQLKAALSLASRLRELPGDERPAIRSPDDVFALVGFEMSALEQEELRVLLLDTKNRVLAMRTVYVGSATATTLRVGELFREAIRQNATAVIVVHNHPSGDPTPSADDVNVTEAIREGGRLLDVAVLDHIVIGQGRHVSLKATGRGFG